MANSVILPNSKVNMGRFLEAVGKALQAPMPAMGELISCSNGWGDFEYEVRADNYLKLKFDGTVNVPNVVVRLADDSELGFPLTILEALQIKLRLVPQCDGQVVKLFDHVQADEPAVLDATQGVFSDAAGTIPANPGDPVAFWKDRD